jgi:hypothetical protein
LSAGSVKDKLQKPLQAGCVRPGNKDDNAEVFKLEEL